MGDEESLCASCSTQPDRPFPMDEVAFGEPGTSPATGPARGTLLLDPPVAPVRRPPEVRYRQPGRTRRSARSVIVVVVVAALVGLGWLAVDGQGPLVPVVERLGLANPSGVSVPDHWGTKVSVEGRFSVELPLGAIAHDAPVDPLVPDLGSFRGFRSVLGEEAELRAVSTDFGLGAEHLRSLGDEQFSELVDLAIIRFDLGEATVRRQALVSAGRAVDTVLVDGEDLTTRIRFLLVDGQVHLLVTKGPERGSRALDQAHAKLLAGYRPTT